MIHGHENALMGVTSRLLLVGLCRSVASSVVFLLSRCSLQNVNSIKVV